MNNWRSGSVSGIQCLDTDNVCDFLCLDVLDKADKYDCAERGHNAGVYGQRSPCAGHVEQEAEQDRRHGLGGHARSVVVPGELADLLRRGKA